MGLVEVSSYVVFDETNSSQREQVDLDDVDEHDVPMTAMSTMAISNVQEQQERDQPSTSTMVQPPTQDDEQAHQDNGMDQGGEQEQVGREEEEDHRHLQPKSAPTFKEIIRWIRFLVTLARE